MKAIIALTIGLLGSSAFADETVTLTARFGLIKCEKSASDTPTSQSCVNTNGDPSQAIQIQLTKIESAPSPTLVGEKKFRSQQNGSTFDSTITVVKSTQSNQSEYVVQASFENTLAGVSKSNGATYPGGVVVKDIKSLNEIFLIGQTLTVGNSVFIPIMEFSAPSNQSQLSLVDRYLNSLAR